MNRAEVQKADRLMVYSSLFLCFFFVGEGISQVTELVLKQLATAACFHTASGEGGREVRETEDRK